MLREIFRFELRQQLRSPLFWLITIALAGVAFGAACSDSIQIGGGIGNIHRNAPSVVITMLGAFSILGLFLITIFVAGAALRDFTSSTAEMMFATPMSRVAYLGGRFAAGWLVSVLVLVGVAVGFWLGSLMPWLDPARLGPTPWNAYGWALAVIVLPNLFFLGALLFLLASLTRSMLGTYVGVIAFVVLVVVAGQLLGHGNIEHQTAGALMNPFGTGAFDLATRYWTASDNNTRVPALAGVILGNRAIWVGIGVALLGVTLALFKPDREGLHWFRGRKKSLAPEPAAPAAPIVLPVVKLRTGFAARAIQFRKLAWFDTVSVLKGTAFLVMLLFGLANLTAALAFTGEIYGTSVHPVTHLMAQAMDGSYKWLLLIVLIFYAGELVWRERGARLSEVVDAFPTPDWIPLLAKVTALAVVIVVFLAVGSLYCMGFQVLRGFHDLQPLLYLQFLGVSLLEFLLLGILSLVFQVWANNKFAGYALIIGWLLLMFGLSQLHLTDNLYHFGDAPDAPYSDMNGFGSFWIGTLWFRAYWYCLAVALLVTAALYWVRGTTSGWRARGRIALQRFGVPARILLAASLVGFVAIGVFLFHNTHGLYRYETHDQQQRQQANYEKAYRKYVGMAQPRITDVNVNVAMYPAARRVDVDGHYVLVNKHDKPIDELLVQLHTLPTRDYRVDLKFPAHTVALADQRQGFYLYKLAKPLAPGASMDFGFRMHVAYEGFANEPVGDEIVHNGTFINSFAFPHFCYDEGRQLTDNNDRRKYGLGPAQRLPKRDDVAAHGNNLISCDADWVHFQATLSTSADQVALAPGYLQKEWTQNGRRYFHYVQDTPILDFFSFQSARYKVARDKWHDVNLEIYYDPQHPYNIQRMFKAMKLSLDYYTQHFGPFQFRQLRILEFPDYSAFAQSFANTIPFSESIGFIANVHKPTDIDYVTYVTAHEIGHQWWAHQAIGASVQGVTMLDESLAQYSALMVMKHLYGPNKMRKFLKYELDRYLSGRSIEDVAEEPLALVENQPYIHYRKASVILYALQDYIGEDKVNAALRTWLDKVKFQQPPYTDTRDLLADLRAQAGPQYQGLITDFFDRITLFDDRMVSATAKKLADGQYQVTLHVHAAKYYADGKGKETRARVDIPIEVGVFAQAKDDAEQDEQPLYLAKVPVKDGDSTITVTVDGKPYEAGIDPFNELVDRVSDDNRAPVTLE
ncbi:MAG TPA: M1 family aminopeptidase [Rhodanobacteraceae bacterium]|jgi:ABC-type transport system involved in multi-copper enzyme maturation permease subunit|nr:M1 family aminopeptidase [Rhodanobacteraceae bacterium]